MSEVFDVPAAIGTVRWSTAWRDHSDAGGRWFATVMSALFAGGGVIYGLASAFGAERLSWPYLLVFPPLGFAAYVFFGPDRHCMCAGERGASISRRRFGFWTTRDYVLYDEADDVELESTRIVSDGVGQIYVRTELRFAFIDKEGYEVFAIDGVTDEPEQRAQPKWNPTAPLQLDGKCDRRAAVGFAALDAFRAFKDQRPIGPYR